MPFILFLFFPSYATANNLMDLIYKRGQAGVTKASVTIVFDNSDRSQSPVGFENTGQITVTRQVSLLSMKDGYDTCQKVARNSMFTKPV